MKDPEEAIMSLPHNSVVIFQANDSDLEKYRESIHSLEDIFKRHKIEAILCPKSILITVVPCGTDPNRVYVSVKGEMN